MREAARIVVTLRHTYNLVDLPIVVAGKSGTAEFGVRDSKGRLPFHSWFVGFVPKNPPRQRRPDGFKASRRRLEPRRPGVRLRLADEGQRRAPRSSSTSSSSTTASRRTTATSTSSSAATSTSRTDADDDPDRRDGRDPGRAAPRQPTGPRARSAPRGARSTCSSRPTRRCSRARAGDGLHEQRRAGPVGARGGHDVRPRA